MHAPSYEPGHQATSVDAEASAETAHRPRAARDLEAVISYSQNAEDVRLWRVFGTVDEGFYVDIGAGDPTDGSVTRLFADRGWLGINVEPGPSFEALRDARPQDINIRAAVGESEGSVSFFLTYPDLGMSTLDPSHHAHVPEAIHRLEEIVVPAYRLETILRDHAAGRTIHFLKVDVEGAEPEVLASSDWDSFRPIVVIVEATASWSVTATHERWEHILTDAGYDFGAFDGINRFYVDGDYRDLIPALAYPISALDRFVSYASQIEAVRTRELEVRLVEATGEAARLESEVDRLRTYEDALAAVFRSRTWRTGRLVASIAAPAVALARAAGLRRPQPRTSVTPQGAYDDAVAEGKAWHFARGTIRGAGRRGAARPLEAVAALFNQSEAADDDAQAAELARKLERLRWTDDESLLSKRLSWAERQAVVEADAVIQLVRRLPERSWQKPSISAHAETAVVVVDARCLQDPGYFTRGVGRHARTVLTAIRAASRGHTIVLLTTPELPELDRRVVESADWIVTTPYAVRDQHVALFFQLSPMTASAAPAVPFLTASTCATASIVYDFIPSTFPAAYLHSAADVVANGARLQALRRYDLLLPISSSTEDACRQLLGADVSTTVTGVANPLDAVAPAALSARPPFVLVPGGGDPRKNITAAVASLARHREAGGPALRGVVAGILTGPQRDAVHDLAHRVGLPREDLELRGPVSEGELLSLYRTAELVFVASIAEGFSIPVAEAVLQGTPVVASNIPAHRELVGSGPWLAEPSNIGGFADAIASVLRDRDDVVVRQRDTLGDAAAPDAVVRRVTAALDRLLAERSEGRPAITTKRAKPCLALVSPFPPQRSGVADYTAFTFRRVAEYADVQVYTAAQATRASGFSCHPLSAEPYVNGRFDSVINIVGNSHFHFAVMDFMASYGGACIAHDNRMIESYLYDRGDVWTARLLSTDAHSVRPEQLEDVLRDLDRAPSIGYELLSRQASPLVVHGQALAERIRAETGVTPVVVPFVPYNVPERGITDAERAQARDALGLADDVLHVATFGIVDRRTKGADLILGASAWLRNWGIDTHLHFVGDGPPEELRCLAELANAAGMDRHVTQHGHVSTATFEQFLLGVDVAVQLRTSALLSLSGAFADCVAFGVPTVTTRDLADEMEAPSYVASTGPITSALLVAEAIDGLRDRRDSAAAVESERLDYLGRRSVDAYARTLLEGLGLGPG